MRHRIMSAYTWWCGTTTFRWRIARGAPQKADFLWHIKSSAPQKVQQIFLEVGPILFQGRTLAYRRHSIMWRIVHGAPLKYFGGTCTFGCATKCHSIERHFPTSANVCFRWPAGDYKPTIRCLLVVLAGFRMIFFTWTRRG